MPTIKIPLGPGSDPARAKVMGEPMQVNAFAEASDQGKAPFALFTDPGLTEYVSFGSELHTRGLFSLAGKLYVVADEHLYSVNTAGTTTLIGTILGTASVIVAINKKTTHPQACIIADSNRYILENDVLSEMADADLPAGVHSVAYLDGYGIFGLYDGTFYISSLNSFDSIDALDFAEAEGDPDGGVRVFVSGRDFYYFGEKSTEVWQNTGNTDFPFERLPGGFFPVGCKSKYTPCNFDNSVVWVDDAGRVVRAESYTAKRISNHGVERDIQRTIDEGRAGEMEAFVYREGGHEFYFLNGPDWTWVYDAASKLWHPKKSHGLDRSKIRQYIRSGDRHIVGDDTAGKLHIMSMDAYDEAGGHLVTELQSPVIAEPGAGLIWDSLLIDVQMGVGRGTDVHSATPLMSLRWSDDGCQTWKGPRERSLGGLGQYGGRIQFNDLGASNLQGRAWKFSVSAPVERCVVSAHAVVRYCAPR